MDSVEWDMWMEDLHVSNNLQRYKVLQGRLNRCAYDSFDFML